MLVIIREDHEAISREAARMVADRVKNKKRLVLGLATGSTPLVLYEELIRMHREEGLDFSNVVTFNLDEYVGLPAEHDQSYHSFMHRHLFAHINVPPENIHIPNGMAADIEAFCEEYDRSIEQAGGIDLQILGIGSNGHIAFNEPGSSLGSRTRIKTLTQRTVADNARFFNGNEEVPRLAITMGIGTIMDAREIILLASGERKADAVRAAIEGPIMAMMPASILQMHPRVYMLLDEKAAADLTSEFWTSYTA